MNIVLYSAGMFDTDGNGVIDFNEFAALWQYVCDWQETFRSFDLDNSGTIDRQELKSGTQPPLFNMQEKI